MKRTEAVVVFSGGQDSTTCLHYAMKRWGSGQVRAVAFNYGQKHSIELQAAEGIASLNGIELEVVDIRGMLVSTSPLTSDTPLDKYDNFAQMEAEVGDKIEKTFVPLRNSVFLTIAFNRAVALGAKHVVTGVCQQDNANYPDCTGAFILAIENSLNESLGRIKHKGGVREIQRDYITIDAPLLMRTKAETVNMAMSLGATCLKSLSHSHTSYDGKYPPTDPNHSNLLRAQGFLEAGVPDPLVIRAYSEGLMRLPATPNYGPGEVDAMMCMLDLYQARGIEE